MVAFAVGLGILGIFIGLFAAIKLVHYQVTYLGEDGNITHSEEGLMMYEGEGKVPEKVINDVIEHKQWPGDAAARIRFYATECSDDEAFECVDEEVEYEVTDEEE